MAFDEVQFPLKAGFGANGGPQFSTEVITIDGGFERRNQNWSQARRRFDARTGVRSAIDAALLSAFFHARAGRARGFRLKDWSDFSSAADGAANPNWDDQIIGTGDGETIAFQLVKNYGSGSVVHRRAIRKPGEGSVVIGVDGEQVETGWTVNTATGLVTFAAPPAFGQTVTAGFQFDVPVRFDTDQLRVTAEDDSQARAEIPLVEVRV
ncbi:MAG: DUF2460 domain-containing protein [Alphaproteobacteria bacterium]|nr:DUF2460 domain-containing protein [Alphaproteobacteria bacterium]